MIQRHFPLYMLAAIGTIAVLVGFITSSWSHAYLVGVDEKPCQTHFYMARGFEPAVKEADQYGTLDGKTEDRFPAFYYQYYQELYKLANMASQTHCPVLNWQGKQFIASSHTRQSAARAQTEMRFLMLYGQRQ